MIGGPIVNNYSKMLVWLGGDILVWLEGAWPLPPSSIPTPIYDLALILLDWELELNGLSVLVATGFIVEGIHQLSRV